jgi:hypothetical protein
MVLLSSAMIGDGYDRALRMIRSWIRLIMLGFTLTVVIGLGVSGAAAQATPLVPGGGLVAGRGYGQWVIAAWQWRVSQPDVTPARSSCFTAAQHGPVWFLGGSDFKGSAITRMCTIPAGRYIMLDVPSVECSTVERPPFYARTDSGLVRCARTWWKKHAGEETLTLDGTTLEPPGYLGGTSAFSFTFPARNNYLHVRGHTDARGAIYGAATILRPLSPGPHTLVQVEAFAKTSYYVTTTYKLNVG